ncbi:hypothetical protein BWK58_10715 [Flavobacterium columnare]|nr:hypothetical protein BWK58_10715 [Flavobacterium columnare]
MQEEIISADPKTKQTKFNHYSEEDKYFFGGFLNNADDNLKQVSKEFKERLNIIGQNENTSTSNDDDNLNSVVKQYINNNKSLAKKEKAINILIDYFPIVAAVKKYCSNNIDETFELFKLLLGTVADLRNFYTHYYHKPITIDEKVYDFLDNTLFDVFMTIKKKKVKNDKSKELLKEKLRPELKLLINLKRKELIQKGKKTENLENAVFNHCLRPFLEETKNSKNKTISLRSYKKSKPEEETTVPITQSGLVFLMSFFLHRKDFQLFISGLEGFKGKVNAVQEEEITLKKNNLVYMISHWSYSYYNFKGLKHRIKTDQGVNEIEYDGITHTITNKDTKEALLTQLVDYLSKVPDEVYNNLSEEQQNEFLEDVNEYMRDNPENEDSSISSIVSHQVIRKRYENKFNYFALRFIDEYGNLPSFRFMVNFGSYIKDRKKKVLDSINYNSERIIKKEIHLFEKLSMVTDYKKNLFLNETATLNLAQFPLFPNPSYVIANNNIPFYINCQKNDLNDYFGKKKSSQSQNQKKNHTYDKDNKGQTSSNIVGELEKALGVKDIKQRSTIGLFSCNELSSMLHEIIVKKTSGVDLENRIAQKIKEQYQIIKDFDSNSYDESAKNKIPKALLKTSKVDSTITFEGKQIDLARLINAVTFELDATHAKIKTVKEREEEVRKGEIEKNQKNSSNKQKTKVKYRKYVFYNNEIGQEASWLAGDLIRYMKNNATWKGYMHSELQALLAFYEEKRNDIITILENTFNLKADCLLTIDLKSLLVKNHKFIDFYKDYLSLKRSFLNEKLMFLKNNDFNGIPAKTLKKEWNSVFEVFKKRQYLIQSTEEKKQNLYGDAINLSRGIFDDKPTMIPNKQPNREEFAAWFVAPTVYEHYQSFYNLIDLNNPKTDTKEQTKQNYKTIRTLNKIKIQDYYLKLMVDALYKDLFGQELNIELKDFYVPKSERESIKADAKNYQQVDNSFLWNKVVHHTLQGGRINATAKLKDIGKYKRAMKDEKIASLLTYDDRTWTYALDNIKDESKQTHLYSLTMELQEYEKVRSKELLKQVQQLEKEILNLDEDFVTTQNHPIIFEVANNPRFRKYIEEGILNKILPNENQVEILRGIDFDDLSWAFDSSERNEEQKEKINLYNQITNPQVQRGLILIMIRNKIAHNQYPPKYIYDLAQTFIPKEENEYFASYFNRVFKEMTKKLLQSLENN